jgi:hypothetical protein
MNRQYTSTDTNMDALERWRQHRRAEPHLAASVSGLN